MCPICTGPFVSPVIVNGCGHEFCEGCLNKSIKQKAECPMCRAKIRKSNHYTKLRRVEQEIGGLRVHCPNKVEGCNEEIKRESIERHVNVCPFELIQCVHASRGCPYESKRHSFGSHLQDCQYEKLKGFIEQSVQQSSRLEERLSRVQFILNDNMKLRQELQGLKKTIKRRAVRCMRARMYSNKGTAPDSTIEVTSCKKEDGMVGEKVTVRLKLNTRMERIREVLEKQSGTQIILYIDGLPEDGGHLVEDDDTSLLLGLTTGSTLYICTLPVASLIANSADLVLDDDTENDES